MVGEIAYVPPSEFNPKDNTPFQAQSETITERLLKFGTLIVKESLNTQAGSLIYKVPLGKTFFLIAASVNMENISNNGNFAAKLAVDALIFNFATSTSLLRISAASSNNVDQMNANISASYAIPLRFGEGLQFFAYDNPSADGNSHSLIQGYEIDNGFLK